jgi:hypothetical protein
MMHDHGSGKIVLHRGNAPTVTPFNMFYEVVERQYVDVSTQRFTSFP